MASLRTSRSERFFRFSSCGRTSLKALKAHSSRLSNVSAFISEKHSCICIAISSQFFLSPKKNYSRSLCEVKMSSVRRLDWSELVNTVSERVDLTPRFVYCFLPTKILRLLFLLCYESSLKNSSINMRLSVSSDNASFPELDLQTRVSYRWIKQVSSGALLPLSTFQNIWSTTGRRTNTIGTLEDCQKLFSSFFGGDKWTILF